MSNKREGNLNYQCWSGGMEKREMKGFRLSRSSEKGVYYKASVDKGAEKGTGKISTSLVLLSERVSFGPMTGRLA